MSGGGGDNATNTVQKADPWAGVQPYLTDLYGRAQSAANATPGTPFGGPFMALPNASQRQASAMQTAQAQQTPQNLGAGALQSGLASASGQYLNAQMNPYLLPAINAAVAPAIRQAQQQIIPGISSEAQLEGAYGGSRHALAQRWANQDVLSQVGQTAATMAKDTFDRERALQMMAPSQIQAGLELNQAPAQQLMAAGTTEQQLQQQEINNALAAYQASIGAPWQPIMPYANVLSGLNPGGGTSSSTTTGPEQSALSGGLTGAIGGGLAGAGLGYGMFGAPLTLAGLGPWGLGGALLGGMLGVMR